MNSWFVVYETRAVGAIGEFGKSGISVIADSQDAALEEARRAFYFKNLEVRFPVKVYQFEENSHA